MTAIVRRTRWAGALGVAALVGASTIFAGPADAATAAAQLTLTGVATSSSPTGGSVVGVHPGDSVKFSAAALPTAGAGSLSGVINGLAGSLSAIEVDLVGNGLPGIGKTVRLSNSKCPGTVSSATGSFSKAATYGFTYTVNKLIVANVLGHVTCTKYAVKLSGSQISALTHKGISIDANSVYHGKVVAAVKPPSGGLPVQIPGVNVSGHVGPINLPSVKVPGVSVPGVKVPAVKVPAAPGVKPGSLINPNGGLTIGWNGLPQTVPERVVPGGGGAAMYYSGSRGLGTDGSPNTLSGTDLPGSSSHPVAISSDQQNAAAGSNSGGHAITGSTPIYVDPQLASAPQHPATPVLPLALTLVALAIIGFGSAYATRVLVRRASS